MLTQHFLGRSHAFMPLGEILKMSDRSEIEREFLDRNLLRQAEMIELADRRFHLIDGDVGAAATPEGLDLSDFRAMRSTYWSLASAPQPS